MFTKSTRSRFRSWWRSWVSTSHLRLMWPCLLSLMIQYCYIGNHQKITIHLLSTFSRSMASMVNMALSPVPPLKHHIMPTNMNVTVGEFNRNDASITLTGLVPGNYYGIRAIATNAAGFSSCSRLIQIQTIPLTGATAPRHLAAAAERRALAQKQSKQPPSRRQHSQSTTNDNEHTNGQVSNTGLGGDESESEETIAFLTKKLNSLRRQQEEIDRQNAEELAENERVKAAGIKEISELRQKVEEKEKAHLEFKKQVNELEKQCKAAQRKKSAKERQLQQKKAETQKRRDDIVRWKAEIIEMQDNTDAMRKEKAELAEAHEKYMASMRKTIDEGNADIKVLEEEIRVWGVKIKAMEDQKRKNDNEQNEEEREAERRERDEEEAHEKRIQELQAQIATLYKLVQQVRLSMMSPFCISSRLHRQIPINGRLTSDLNSC